MKHRFLFLCTALLMVVLGTNDAMRGVFLPLFRDGFGFSIRQLGIVVSLSYLGNLACLLLGGYLLDKTGKQPALVLFILLLAAGELFLLHGSHFSCLAAGFFLTLGLSTLLNTTVNLVSSEFSRSRRLLVTNSLFFIQGLGTSGSQLVFSRFSSDQAVFDALVFSIVICLAVLCIPFASSKGFARQDRTATEMQETGKTDIPSIGLLTATLAFYMIAEHGVTNYLIVFGTEQLGSSAAATGRSLALFSVGIMVGRLLLAPLVDRSGALKTMTIALGLGTVTYVSAFATSRLYLLSLAGFFISVTYPSIVAVVSDFTPDRFRSRMTTLVISLASIADILFNLAFGPIVQRFGYLFAMGLLCASLCIAFLSMTVLKIRASDQKRLAPFPS
jgi:MFS family permease